MQIETRIVIEEEKKKRGTDFSVFGGRGVKYYLIAVKTYPGGRELAGVNFPAAPIGL
jgi:hypothetical protein